MGDQKKTQTEKKSTEYVVTYRKTEKLYRIGLVLGPPGSVVCFFLVPNFPFFFDPPVFRGALAGISIGRDPAVFFCPIICVDIDVERIKSMHCTARNDLEKEKGTTSVGDFFRKKRGRRADVLSWGVSVNYRLFFHRYFKIFCHKISRFMCTNMAFRRIENVWPPPFALCCLPHSHSSLLSDILPAPNASRRKGFNPRGKGSGA